MCWGQAFGYDPWGNLNVINSTLSQCAAGILNAPADQNNRIIGYNYDAAGDLLYDGVYTYTWDAEGRMATASSSLNGSETYTYDGDGHRVRKQTAGRLYWYGSGSEVLAETDASGNDPTEYIFFGGKRIARRDSSGNVSYYLSDMLGSSRVVTDSNGNLLDDCDFLPYGEERCAASSSGNHYKFDGMERDSESGLDHTLHRQYTSNYGRWLSPDPGGVKVVNLEDPQTWNLYSFVRDTPTTLTDPTGLQQQTEGSYQSRGTSTVCAQGEITCNRSGDVTKVNGQPVDKPTQAQNAINTKPPGPPHRRTGNTAKRPAVWTSRRAQLPSSTPVRDTRDTELA
jgi:RHS repeat-associated protein